jgi:AraC family transcriptional activator of pyochelin receptor
MHQNGKLSARDIERIYEAARILRKYLTQDLTIKDLAGMVLLNEKKLKQGFKQEFEMGAHAYQRYIRLEKVKLMLLEERPRKEIVQATGFKTESGLSKTFKKVVGVTPTKWKENYEH